MKDAKNTKAIAPFSLWGKITLNGVILPLIAYFY
jgi:hypothetical protein